MAHLIEPIWNTSLKEGIDTLSAAHDLIVRSAISGQSTIKTDPEGWAAALKRLEIQLPAGTPYVGKGNEKFVEIINILATSERTIAALKWLATKFPDAQLRECHASTSDNPEGSDIVIVDDDGHVIARCEVTDVTASNAGQNGKEKKDLKNLGCQEMVPLDNVYRYIATSKEFAGALSSNRRKWASMHYRYIAHLTNFECETHMLEIRPAESVVA